MLRDLDDPALERFFTHVEIADCWLRQGCVNHRGYGLFSAPDKLRVVHRWIWEALVGPIPEGLQVDHLCMVRNCVNPDHLEPVTTQVNAHRSHSVSGINVRKTACWRGHDFTERNTRLHNGKRHCRKCAVINTTASQARKKARELSV